jgi:PadR family transcriptional regulator PadR
MRPTLLQGTLDLFVLRALQKGRSHGAVEIEDAALYQALHRLESRGWIAAEWGVSENNRRARFYELTADGRKQLRIEVSSWKQYAAAVMKVIE